MSRERNRAYASFDFNNSPEESQAPECTYEIFYSSNPEASADHPMLVLDNREGQLKHHSNGTFTNPIRKTAFEFKGEAGTVSADILKIDARFVSHSECWEKSYQCAPLRGIRRMDTLL